MLEMNEIQIRKIIGNSYEVIQRKNSKINSKSDKGEEKNRWIIRSKIKVIVINFKVMNKLIKNILNKYLCLRR